MQYRQLRAFLLATLLIGWLFAGPAVFVGTAKGDLDSRNDELPIFHQSNDGRWSDISEINTSKVAVVVIFQNESARNTASLTSFNATITGGEDIDFMPVLFANLPKHQMGPLESSSNVTDVLVDTRVSVPSKPATDLNTTVSTDAVDTTGEIPWGIKQINARKAARNVSSIDQRNTKVAVLDTGIDLDHPAVSESAVWGANMVDGESYGLENAADDHGHGTSVSSIIAGDTDSKVVGVAPDVSLYPIKVLNESNFGYSSWVIKGIDAGLKGPDQTLGTDDDADVISMSLVNFPYWDEFDSTVSHANEYATLVASAGNNGDGDPTTNTVTYPAKYDDVIAVAATQTDNTTPTFSAEGNEVELAAPGVSVRTASINGGTHYFTGTSAAAPHVSGVAALLIAADEDVDARSIMINTALDIESDGISTTSGHGLVDAEAAVSEIGRDTAGTNASVSLIPTSQNATVNRNIQFNISAEGIDTGVKSYQFNLSVANSSTATISKVGLEGTSENDSLTTIEVADNGSNVWVAAGSAGHDNGVLASASVKGEKPGSTNLSLSDVEVGNINGDNYPIEKVQNASVTVVEEATGDRNVSVGLKPEAQNINVNETTMFEVAVEGASNRLNSYEFDFIVQNGSTASIQGLSLGGTTMNDTFTEVDFKENGTNVSVAVGDADLVNGTLATVTVMGDAQGTTELLLRDVTVADEDANSYTIKSVNNATIAVLEGEGPAVVGDSPAQDLNGDGIFEDVNGDGSFDIVDVSAMFQKYQDQSVQDNATKFDFNADGKVNIVDVNALFQTAV